MLNMESSNHEQFFLGSLVILRRTTNKHGLMLNALDTLSNAILIVTVKKTDYANFKRSLVLHRCRKLRKCRRLHTNSFRRTSTQKLSPITLCKMQFNRIPLSV